METTKVALYVAIATLSTFLMQFMTQIVDKGIENLNYVTGVVWIVIIGNSALQGLIAWKAKLSSSPEQAQEIKDGQERQDALINTVIGKVNRE